MSKLLLTLSICVLLFSCSRVIVENGRPQYFVANYQAPTKTLLRTNGYYVFRFEYCARKKRFGWRTLRRISGFTCLRFFPDGSVTSSRAGKKDAAQNVVPKMDAAPLTWGFYKIDGDTLRIELFSLSYEGPTLAKDKVVNRACHKFLMSVDSLIPLSQGFNQADRCLVRSFFVVALDRINRQNNFLLYNKKIRRELKLEEYSN